MGLLNFFQPSIVVSKLQKSDNGLKNEGGIQSVLCFFVFFHVFCCFDLVVYDMLIVY
jgi:hypothetical protein